MPKMANASRASYVQGGSRLLVALHSSKSSTLPWNHSRGCSPGLAVQRAWSTDHAFQHLQNKPVSCWRLLLLFSLWLWTFLLGRNNATAASILQNTEKPGNSFTQDLITYNHPTAPLASFNQRLAKRLRTPGNARRVRDHVLEIVQEIRQRNLKLDLNTYNALLVAHTRVSDAKAILATLNEMEAEGIQPSLDSYNTMLEASLLSGYRREKTPSAYKRIDVIGIGICRRYRSPKWDPGNDEAQRRRTKC